MTPESAGYSRASGVTRRCCSQARVRRPVRKVRKVRGGVSFVAVGGEVAHDLPAI